VFLQNVANARVAGGWAQGTGVWVFRDVDNEGVAGEFLRGIDGLVQNIATKGLSENSVWLRGWKDAGGLTGNVELTTEET
jgi:hypothetical protein